MVGLEGVGDNLLAARETLKRSLDRSKDISSAINETGSRLAKSSQNLALLKPAIQTIASSCALYEIKKHVNRAVGPVGGVLEVFSLVNELETSLRDDDPGPDLFGYLNTIRRIEEALQLLAANCRLVVLWLEDLVQFLKGKKVADDWCFSRSLILLRELKGIEERYSLREGVLMAALQKLENELRRLLMLDGFPSPPVLLKVQAIIEQLGARDRLERCICIYAEIRSSSVRADALQGFNLEYLDQSLSEFKSVQGIEGYIDQWGRLLEITVKDLEMEKRLCKEVFQKAENDDIWMDCFAKIALQSGICGLIRFGNAVAEGKKEAIKMLNLLEVFAVLSRLRVDFNRLFSNKSCEDIQNQTRDLIKNVVSAVTEIFWELNAQVELQVVSRPPADGSVPRMVSFVIDFCNQLLEDEYMSVLIQILEIHGAWNHESFKKEVVPAEVRNILKTLEMNIATWAKTYKEAVLSCLFLMNNHCYLCNNVSGTKLGDLMGRDWLSEQKEYMEYYTAIFLKESWGKLPALLSEEGLILFPGGRAIDQNLFKKRLHSFAKVFEDMSNSQSGWILSDEGLRLKICRLIIHTVVPPYKSYVHKYIRSGEYEENSSIHVKYTAANLENMITSLFQREPGNNRRTKCSQLMDEVSSIIHSNISSTPAAA